MKNSIVVVGGGHAGLEAAIAGAKLGCKVTLITPSRSKISLMSCNPAIGGIAKGTLVKEIDALGGVTAVAADLSALQFRMLNQKKGPAVWGPRAQSDINVFSKVQISHLLKSKVDILEGVVVKFMGKTENITGVLLSNGQIVTGDAFVLAAGTFLGGMLHRGAHSWPGGRRGDISSNSLKEDLVKRMFHVKQYKTGTSPRILRKTIDFSCLDVQESHDVDFRFSESSREGIKNIETCWLARTQKITENIVKTSLRHSPLYSGRITGKGPRYCPSFEDKVTKFPERSGHPIHVEPLSYRSRQMYLNGLSTSLPEEIQEKTVRSLPGFKNVIISSFGYSVEYSCFTQGEFLHTLRLSRSENLYVAGQILGTSGYEEAAATGLLAGSNAAKRLLGDKEVVPDRMKSYLGVMVDDLVSKGSDEPYRLFTSRSENRLHLRQDNAERRLFETAKEIGLLSLEQHKQYIGRNADYDKAVGLIKQTRVNGKALESIVKQPETTTERVFSILGSKLESVGTGTVTTAILDFKYSGYVSRALTRFKVRLRHAGADLSFIEDYNNVQYITIEAREALNKARPATLREAENLPAVRQADIDGLVLYLMKKSVSRET